MKNSYEVRGEVTAIFLNYKGEIKETLIDTADLPLLLQSDFSWMASYAKSTNTFYAKGYGPHRNGKQKRADLHRFLMDAPKGVLIDHRNHDGLDNRRSNLRKATVSQNLQNRKGLTKHNTSGYRGVSFDKESGKYKAYIRINNKLKSLGRYKSAEEAARVAFNARKKYMPYSNEVAPWK